MIAMSPHLPSVDPMTRTPALLALLLVTSTLAFVPSVEAGPTIAGVSPPTGSSNGGQLITIDGADFVAGAVVEVGTSSELATVPAPPQNRATNVTVTGTKITATVPPHAPAGQNDILVRVRNPDGQAAEFAGLFSYTQAPTPTVSSVTPSVVASNGGATVTVNGQNFDPKSRSPEVRFGGVAGVVLAVSATQISVVAPGHAPGIVGVTVTFPGAPTGSCTGCFQYAASARPSVFSITPAAGAKSGGTLVTISGTDFAPGSQVVFDNGGSPTAFVADEFAAEVIYSSPTQITAMAPAQPAGLVGTQARVRVVNPGALDAAGAVPSPDSNSHVSTETDVIFTYAAATSAPNVTAASPNRGSPAGGTRVTLTGVNLHAGANEEPQVLVSPESGTPCGGTPVAARIVSRTTTSLVVDMPPLAAGRADIRVVNPDGGGATSASACHRHLFRYVAPLAIHGLSAVQGPTAGGTSAAPGTGSITVTGEGFLSGATVTFLSPNEGPQGFVSAVTATSLSVVPPPHTKGDVTVILTNPDGRSATFFRYTYAESAAPTLTSVGGAATSNGGELLTIGGSGFHFGVDPDGAGPLQPLKPSVKVGSVDVPAADITGTPGVVNSFTVKAPAQTHSSITGSPTLLSVTVKNPDGREAASDALTATNDQASYTKSLPPVAATAPLSVTQGPTYGGTLVTFNGGNLSALGARPSVTVGGTAATVVGTPTGTTLRFLTPPATGLAASADRDVVVTNPDGQSVTVSDNAKDFDYAATGAPTASSLSQASGPTVGGTVVAIAGANLGSATMDSAETACTGAPGGVPTPASFDGTKVVGPLPTVTFDGKPAKVLCLVDGATDSLVVVAPARSQTGSAQVVVTAANGQSATASEAFTYGGSAGPSLDTVANEITLPVTGGLMRTFAGTGFAPVTRDLDGRTCGDAAFDKAKLATPVPRVRFVGLGEANPPTTTDVCVRQVGEAVVLDVVVPAHSAGPVSVQVFNPDDAAFNRAGIVRYVPLPPILTASTATPPTAATSSLNGGSTVTLTARNLLTPPPALLVRGAATAPAEVVSGTETSLVARVPASSALGAADLLAVDPDGQTGTLDGGLSYVEAPAPVFTSVSLRTGSLNGGTNVTLTGSGFARSATVVFGGVVLDKVSVWDDGKKLAFVTPNVMQMPAEARRLSPVDVTVLNPVARTAAPLECPGLPGVTLPGLPPAKVLTNHCLVLDDLFGYSTVVAPHVVSISPATGGQGTAVTITGANFASPATVLFGSTAATDVTVVSPTSITAKAPAGTGVVGVTVTVNGQSHTLPAAFTFTATTPTPTSSSTTTTTSRSTTTTSSGSTTPPTGVTPQAILDANQRISVEVTREGESNRVTWELPSTGLPATVAGIQVWGSNSPYSLLQTCAAGSACFSGGEFRHTGAEARAGTEYLVTMFYGTTEALGFYTQSNAPDTAVYPGTSSEDSGGPQDGGDGGSGRLPNWAIVLIVLGVLFLIVLVAILIARGRSRGPRQQAAAQGYAWEEAPAAEAAAASAEWDGDQAPEVHQARCPACATTFTATGTKPIVTVCPGCGKKGILR